MADVARALGFAPAPHQREVWDTALELENGVPAYRELLLSLGRQDGKTSMVLAMVLWRCLVHQVRAWGARSEIVIVTAQTQTRAEELLKDQWWPLIQASPFSGQCGDIYKRAGSVRIPFKNGSVIKAVAPDDNAARGDTKVGMIVIDEAARVRDGEVEKAARGTMLHRLDGQIVIASNAGDDTSWWWRSKYDMGIEAATLDTGRGVMFMDWGASVDDDPREPATWLKAKPLVASGAISLDTMAAEVPIKDADLPAFQQEHLNVWGTGGGGLIPSKSWDAVVEDELALGDIVAIAVDTNPEMSRSFVYGSDARGRVGLLHQEPFTAWVGDYLTSFTVPVVIDGLGKLAHKTDEWRAAGIDVQPASGGDCCDAAQLLLDEIALEQPFIAADDFADEAAVHVQPRKMGQRQAFGRGNNLAANVAPIIAISLARWKARKPPEEPRYTWHAS